MSTGVLRGRGSGPTRPSDRELAIGDADHEIFNCPVCQRPLARGSMRCPGCGSRLLLGIRARTAMTFLLVGGLIGAIVGGLLVTITLLSVRTVAPTIPILGGGPSPAPSIAPPSAAPVPSSAANALVRTTGINARMQAQRPALAVAVKPSKPNTGEVARILRAIASDASLAADAVPTLSAWPDGRPLAYELQPYYAQLRQSALSALDVSLNNAAAYRRNGQSVVALLDRIAGLQAKSKELADAHGIDIGL